jgi:hypothetical protein
MNSFSKNILIKKFGNIDFRFKDVRHISYSNRDDEALKDVAAFLDVQWVNVTPMMFRKHFEVFPFFSDFAFFVFTPALISCSSQDFSTVHLSIDIFLHTLLEHSDLEVLNALNIKRWQQFSTSQLEIITSWIKQFNKNSLGFFSCDEINKYLERLDKLIYQAGEFEKRMQVASTIG